MYIFTCTPVHNDDKINHLSTSSEINILILIISCHRTQTYHTMLKTQSILTFILTIFSKFSIFSYYNIIGLYYGPHKYSK